MSICPLYTVPHHLWQRRARLQAHFDTKEHTVLESGFHGCCGSDNSEHPIELHRGHNPTTQKAVATSCTLHIGSRGSRADLFGGCRVSGVQPWEASILSLEGGASLVCHLSTIAGLLPKSREPKGTVASSTLPSLLHHSSVRETAGVSTVRPINCIASVP